jgi:extradiol dioxygenase family protein
MESSSMPPFHLAFPVTDLAATRQFYVAVLGAREARQIGRAHV